MLLRICPKSAIFVLEMAGKARIPGCLMTCMITQETVVSFYIVYQVVMRKFTLAGKTICELITYSFDSSDSCSLKIGCKSTTLF